jgi:hypothetical protein
MTIRLRDFFTHFKGEPHQLAAVELLQSQMPASLLSNEAEWVQAFRAAPAAKEPPPVPKPDTSSFPNTWAGVTASARSAGAKYPELVAAQWALESGWGKHTSGLNNFFGLKGSGSEVTTGEFINGKWVTVKDSFLNFPTLDASVQYLVDRWYKDFKQFKGVNNAPNRNAAAQQLVKEGYATDPDYAAKLIKLMDQQAPAAAPPPPAKPPTTKVSPKSPFETRLTPNIQVGEFALWQEARRFHHQYQVDTALELAQFLEKARAAFGNKPVVITSGFRPAAINRSVGGASGSEHLFNAPGVGAVDWYIKGVNVKTVQDWCVRNWPYSTGLGAPKGFIHTGIRKGRPRITWDY